MDLGAEACEKDEISVTKSTEAPKKTHKMNTKETLSRLQGWSENHCDHCTMYNGKNLAKVKLRLRVTGNDRWSPINLVLEVCGIAAALTILEFGIMLHTL